MSKTVARARKKFWGIFDLRPRAPKKTFWGVIFTCARARPKTFEGGIPGELYNKEKIPHKGFNKGDFFGPIITLTKYPNRILNVMHCTLDTVHCT